MASRSGGLSTASILEKSPQPKNGVPKLVCFCKLQGQAVLVETCNLPAFLRGTKLRDTYGTCHCHLVVQSVTIVADFKNLTEVVCLFTFSVDSQHNGPFRFGRVEAND
jgi:hypothetical protein